MKKIAFHTESLGLRGTEVALYDYAYNNQDILDNKSVVFYKNNPLNDISVINKFSEKFELIKYENFSDLSKISDINNVDAVYFIKEGHNDGKILSGVPNIIHAVFPQKPKEVHGNSYAFVSKWLSKECANYKVPYVPHIVQLPDVDGSLRGELNIPVSAIVYGCYGGRESFDIAFVKNVIREVIENRKNIYFIFMNINKFFSSENVIFLNGSGDLIYKTKFINTCDAMLHARALGESFGLACGEFSIRNKPIITYELSPHRSHIDILGNKALLYKNKMELYNIIINFDRDYIKKLDWNCYSEVFSPKIVMKKFNSVFLSNYEESYKNKIKFSDIVIIKKNTYLIKIILVLKKIQAKIGNVKFKYKRKFK